MLTGPLAAAGVLAGAWGGSHLATRHASSAAAAAAGITRDAHSSGIGSLDTITVTVRPSASLQSLLRERSVGVVLPRGATVGALLNRLSGDYPVLAALGPSVMAAVSGAMVRPETTLTAGEVIELMIPTAGG